jgi:hypothetical protein
LDLEALGTPFGGYVNVVYQHEHHRFFHVPSMNPIWSFGMLRKHISATGQAGAMVIALLQDFINPQAVIRKRVFRQME